MLTIRLTPREDALLREEARSTGQTMNRIVQRALTEHFKQRGHFFFSDRVAQDVSTLFEMIDPALAKGWNRSLSQRIRKLHGEWSLAHRR
jgi:DNA-binding protein Fis